MTQLERYVGAGHLEANRRWNETGTEGAALSWCQEDLAGADLRGANLAGGTLVECNFTGALLDKADLGHLFAGGSRFDGAQMAETYWKKANLEGASFVGAQAVGARFMKAMLRDAIFDRAGLQRAEFDGSHVPGARFVGADLRDTSWGKASLHGADLTRADLRGARFVVTMLDVATRFDGAIGIAEMQVESILVGGRLLEGADARAWIEAQAARPAWTIEDLEVWMLAKMRGPRAEAARAQIGRSVDPAVAAVFDKPGHAAAEYQRILGAHVWKMAEATGTFAGSYRHEYVLPLWPDVVFVVNEHPDGYAWGQEFQGGPAELPADLASIEPWRWTAERLRREATHVEVLEEWSFDLEAILTFASGARFHARFDLGLLQAWEPAKD